MYDVVGVINLRGASLPLEISLPSELSRPHTICSVDWQSASLESTCTTTVFISCTTLRFGRGLSKLGHNQQQLQALPGCRAAALGVVLRSPACTNRPLHLLLTAESCFLWHGVISRTMKMTTLSWLTRPSLTPLTARSAPHRVHHAAPEVVTAGERTSSEIANPTEGVKTTEATAAATVTAEVRAMRGRGVDRTAREAVTTAANPTAVTVGSETSYAALAACTRRHTVAHSHQGAEEVVRGDTTIGGWRAPPNLRAHHREMRRAHAETRDGEPPAPRRRRGRTPRLVKWCLKHPRSNM